MATGSSTGHPERADARANRQRVIAAAFEVFTERGAAAEMKEIAERAGVGVGTIYRNFATKDELIAAIIGEVVFQLEHAVEAAVEREDPTESVCLFLQGVVSVVDEFGSLCRAIVTSALTEDIASGFMGFMDDERMEAVIRRGITCGAFRADLDPSVARAMLYGLCDPLIYLIARNSNSRDDVIRGFTELTLRAFGARPPSPET